MPGNYGRKLTILVETFIYIINYIRSSKRENETFIYIINYIRSSKRENDLRTL